MISGRYAIRINAWHTTLTLVSLADMPEANDMRTPKVKIRGKIEPATFGL